MFWSTRRLNREAELIGRAEHHAGRADEAEANAKAAVDNLARAAQKHSRFARIVAEFLVACDYPGLKDCEPRDVALALHEAIESAGIDLSIEMGRLRKENTEPFVDGARHRALTMARRLELSERARASLAEQLATAQSANERWYREAADRAASLEVSS